MTDAMRHRGPDAEGFWSDGKIHLGHRRLSIIDLSSSANQPLHSSNKNLVMVYNGELYNFKELKEQLNSQHKVSFNTESDSEVILEGIQLHGDRFLEKMKGMFALAIYEKESKTLHLYRDRIGIKPLYYYWDGTQLAFASELRALKSLPHLNFEIEEEAINYFLQLGYVPAPLSIYRFIKKLEPGQHLELSDNKLRISSYWSPEEHLQPTTLKDEQECKTELGKLLDNSVKQHLQSDVPVGVFLSGGIDSGLVAAYAAKNSGRSINTYSIGFEINEFDESASARKIAAHLGAHHHESIITEKQAQSMVEQMLEWNDEPFADSSFLPTQLVSELARKDVTVALSGDGGDELFMGYGTYQWAQRLSHPLIRTFKTPISFLLSQSSNYKRHSHYFDLQKNKALHKHIFTVEQNFFEIRELEKLGYRRRETQQLQQLEGLWESLNHQNRKLDPAEKQALFDLHYYLPDDLLTKVDRASMLHSLEARVPFLDHEIVEFALNVDPALKVKGATRKYLSRQLLFEMVPEKLYQGPKRGFAIPLSKWLKGDLSHLIERHLSDENLDKYPVLKKEYIKELIIKFNSGRYDYLYNRIWNLIVLYHWMERNT